MIHIARVAVGSQRIRFTVYQEINPFTHKQLGNVSNHNVTNLTMVQIFAVIF